MFSLKDKRILITGAAGGIGKSVWKQCMNSGAKVFVTGTSLDKLHSCAQEIGCEKSEYDAHACDINNTDEIKSLVSKAVEVMGGLDILMHVAGMTKDGLFPRMPREDWDKVISTNLTSAFDLSQAASAVMMKQKHGRIIFFSSVVGSSGNFGQANYIASKAGLTGLSKGIATDLARWNITCNCVEPGFIATPMTDVLPDNVKEHILSGIPSKRMGTPDEVAAAAIFLASDEAAYITGTSIRVNGGMLMI